MKEETRKVSINLTQKHYNALDDLVKQGEYSNFSEAIRDAIRKFLEVKYEGRRSC